MTINLNDWVKVKLTDLGKEIYYHRHDRLIEHIRNHGIEPTIKPSFPKEDAEGKTRFQLWDFMELYGEHIGMMKPNVIEHLDIEVKVENADGHWIDNADKIDAQFGRHTYKCSECGKYAEYFVSGTEVWWDRIKPNYCPNCGAKMEVENDA